MNEEAVNIRSGNNPAELKQAILNNLYFIQGRPLELATLNDWYMATAYAVRDRMMKHWIDLIQRLYDKDLKIVGYLSAEFLMGPHLGNALINLGIYDETKEAVESLGLDLNKIMTDLPLMISFLITTNITKQTTKKTAMAAMITLAGIVVLKGRRITLWLNHCATGR